MTPAPTVGDIWEWYDRMIYALVEQLGSSTEDNFDFKALNLTGGGMEIISINSKNIYRWKRLS